MRSITKYELILLSLLGIFENILLLSHAKGVHPERRVSRSALRNENVVAVASDELTTLERPLNEDMQKYDPSVGSSSYEDNEYHKALAPLASLDIYSNENVDASSDTESELSYRNKQDHVQYPQKYPIETTSVGNGNKIGTSNSSSSSGGSIAGSSIIGDNNEPIGSGSVEDVPKFKSVEYDNRSGGGPLLDEFVTGQLNSAETSNALPVFLTEPESAYIVKNRPAIIKCKAAQALQLHFKCSGSSQPPPSTYDKHVDPHAGIHMEEVTATIHRDLVDEYFGKGPFKCECHAWSSRGVVKSQAATINIAFMRKQFATSPTSLRVEIGTRADLNCQPPDGFPEPTLTWYKNNAPITENAEHGPTVSPTGTLTFQQVTLLDMANYTCNAENIAGKRTSDSAVVIVYVNGGWSPWSPWRECKCAGKPSQGRKRTRTCSNPLPLNGGSQCSGPQIQKSSDCITCPEDTQIVNPDGFEILSNKRPGRWSSWSEWSSCSLNCIQIRRRKCVNGAEESLVIGSNMASASSGPTGVGNGPTAVGFVGKLQCTGKDVQTAECRGEYCQIGKDDFDWTLYLGLAFVTAVCFAFGAALIWCGRRGIRNNSHYNMARTGMDTEYIQGVDKKEMRMHIEAANISYDYANPAHAYLPNDHIGSCAMSEHHYDVPNLTANYTNPIDDLSVDYLSDTPDTSTADTSNSTYDLTAKVSTLSVSKSTASETMGSAGGSLRLYNGEIMFYIPELAITKSLKKHVSLMLLSDDSSTRISLPTAESAFVICSTIVYCAPRNYSFQKPVILKIPHCLVDTELWNVYIYYADNDCDDLNVSWRKLIVVGEETINTPVFVQLERSHVYIMTEQVGRFVVVADPKPSISQPFGTVESASIKMKLIAFSQTTPSSTNSSLRVYVVKDFPNSKDICTNVEIKLGGSYVGESESFAFQLNNSNLNIRVRFSENMLWGEESTHGLNQPQERLEHVIPYNHILSNNSILHCEFNLRRSEQLMYEVEFSQGNSTGSVGGLSVGDLVLTDPVAVAVSVGVGVGVGVDVYSFSIRSQCTTTSICSSHEVNNDLQQATTVSIDRQGNYVNDTGAGSLESIQLPRVTKRLICAALDPPRADERDWRLLAKKLNTDRYIAYFATKSSPTEQILNLCECRASSSSHTILELLMTLNEMERQDVMNIITETFGPLWI